MSPGSRSVPWLLTPRSCLVHQLFPRLWGQHVAEGDMKEGKIKDQNNTEIQVVNCLGGSGLSDVSEHWNGVKKPLKKQPDLLSFPPLWYVIFLRSSLNCRWQHVLLICFEKGGNHVLIILPFGVFLPLPVMAAPFLTNARKKGEDDMKTLLTYECSRVIKIKSVMSPCSCAWGIGVHIYSKIFSKP